MFPNLFILNNSGDVLIENHFSGHVKRSVIDSFWEVVAQHTNQNEVPPVIESGKYFIINVRRYSLFFVTVLETDVPPLLGVEALCQSISTLKRYFKAQLGETVIRENFALIYQLLGEMFDGGFMLTLEPNQLSDMIPPPSMSEAISQTFSSKPKSAVSDVLSTAACSKIPWRRKQVKYLNNSIKMDFIEKLDVVVGPGGQVVSSFINGSIESSCELSGMPDLTLSFSNPNLLESVQLHRCVRIHRFQRDKVVSFVPPDQKFTLLRFRVPGSNTLPIIVTPTITLQPGKSSVHVKVTPGPGVKTVERLALELRFPRRTMAFNLSCNIGKLVPDEISKLLQWNIGKLTEKKTPTLEGSVVLPKDFDDDIKVIIKVLFECKNYSASGLKIEALSIHNVKYKPFKGMRNLTRAASFIVRTN